MQAQDHQFKVGDKAVYPAQGVTEVISIEDREFGGNTQSFYVLRVMDTDRQIMVPVNNAKNVGLRPPIIEKDILKIEAILKETPKPAKKQPWSRRYRGFMEKIQTGDVFDVAEVMRDLYRIKSEKELSHSERRILEQARDLIVKEIAVARAKPAADVQAKIESFFDLH